MSPTGVCAYCGEVRVLTNEHIFPDCFQKTFDGINIAKTPSGDKAIAGGHEIGDVCGCCNNGPLSQLDTYFCALNDQYFSTIVYPADFIRFQFDFDYLLRALLKIGYNVARTRSWPLSNWIDATDYIL